MPRTRDPARRIAVAPPGPRPARVPGWLPRVLVESVLIVFSVLLALAVDGWREGRAHRRQAAAAHAEILEELGANRAAVAESWRYHGLLLDSLAAHRASGREPSPTLFNRGFVAPAALSQTAWASASETGALSHMDYATVLRLSGVYAQQQRYVDQSGAFGELLYAEIYHRGIPSIAANHANLASIIGAFGYREQELLAVYDRALADAPGPAPEPDR